MDVTRRQLIKALAVLAGATVASQFDGQLAALAQALSGPQVWTLSFDEREVNDLIQRGIRMGGVITDTHGRPAVECTLEFETPYLWALAILTDPDGDEWRTVDGETWTQGEMVL